MPSPRLSCCAPAASSFNTASSRSERGSTSACDASLPSLVVSRSARPSSAPRRRARGRTCLAPRPGSVAQLVGRASLSTITHRAGAHALENFLCSSNVAEATPAGAAGAAAARRVALNPTSRPCADPSGSLGLVRPGEQQPLAFSARRRFQNPLANASTCAAPRGKATGRRPA